MAPHHHYHYHSHNHHCHQHVGLGLVGPILLNTATAPAERIRLLLQCQDEVILNMSQEAKSQQRTIMAHAQLPYKDMGDCVNRLVEKEGTESLWRGYSIEVGRYVLQSGIEAWMRRTAFRRLFRLSKDQVGYLPWFTGLAVAGTVANSISLLLVYPLMTLHTRMATDVVRRSKVASKKTKKRAVSPVQPPASLDASTATLEETDHGMSDTELVSLPSKNDAPSDPSSSAVSSSTSENKQEDEEQKEEDNEAEEEEESPVEEYELAYKYKDMRDAYDEIIETEGYLGLYKGLSTMVLSTFVSRVGFLAMFDAMSPILVQAGPGRGLAVVGPLAVVFGATSLLTLAIYPLSTIGHRRMIAAPGRYKSSWDAAQKIYEKHGWRGFFNGVEVAILRSAAIAILSRVL